MVKDITILAKKTDQIINEQMQDPIFSKLSPSAYDTISPYVSKYF